MNRPPTRPLGPDEESVWDYPRPPRLEPVQLEIRVEIDERVIGLTKAGWRMLETSHPPVYYIPPDDVDLTCLVKSSTITGCEWKGQASYYSYRSLDGHLRQNVAWYYPEPVPRYEEIRDHVAFYPSRVDACFVNNERVTAQEGDFYGGWITKRIVGPFKGPPGTWGW